MTRRRRLKAACAAAAFLAAAPASAERLITSVSASRVLITSSYTGAELVLFGAIERDGVSISRSGTYDIVVTVKGPAGLFTVREKQRFGPFWVNAEQAKYAEVPGYFAMHSSRALSEVTSEPLRERFQLGLEQMVAARGGAGQSPQRIQTFHEALIRLKKEARLFQANDRGVVFLAPNLFRAAISLPATAPLGNYEALAQLFAERRAACHGEERFRSGQDRLRGACGAGRVRPALLLRRRHGAAGAGLRLALALRLPPRLTAQSPASRFSPTA
jgi:uncharacterized protein (TIGR02186 family)